MSAETLKCEWFPHFEIADWHLEPILTVSYVITLFLGLWLHAIIYKTKLKQDSGYYNVLKFTATATLKQSLIIYFKYKDYFKSNPMFPCRTYSFLENLLAVAEIEALTMACIDRYVLAKYKVNGWARDLNHNSLYNNLIFFFATVYSCAPLVSIGQYGYDFICQTCTYDMKLPSFWIARYLVILVFFLKTVKPTCVMIVMLIWARIMENKLPNTFENQAQKKITNITAIIAVENCICWAPMWYIRGSVLLNQQFYGILVMPSSAFVFSAIILYCIPPIIHTCTLYILDTKIRSRASYIFNPHEFNEQEEEQRAIEPIKPKAE